MALSANEFRLGNLVYYHIEDKMDERKEWDEVSPIDYDDLRCFVEYEDNSEYKPIPLTEERLLKFGFEKRGHVKFLGEAYQRFVLGRNGIYSVNEIAYIYEINDHDLCEIKYAHQLQNLYFALTGEELSLKQ
jgi:hypothetical protein